MLPGISFRVVAMCLSVNDLQSLFLFGNCRCGTIFSRSSKTWDRYGPDSSERVKYPNKTEASIMEVLSSVQDRGRLELHRV